MKIASWNVNGIRACYNKGLLEFIEEHNPDILCLQETKAHPHQLTDSIRNIGNYTFRYWSSSAIRKGYSGTLTCVSQSPLQVSYGMGIKKFDREGRFVITEYEKFILLNIYFPNGSLTEERHLFKQEFLLRFTDFAGSLEKQKNKPLIILGDYNTAYLDRDVYSPETLQKTSGFLPEERKWLTDFLSNGFIDVFRYFYPEQKEAFTWWSYRENARQANRGWRIDHICVSEPLKNSLKNVQICEDQKGSDHCPVIVEMDT